MVSQGQISVGDLTSLLLYTVYVGSGLQMLTYVSFTLRGHLLSNPRSGRSSYAPVLLFACSSLMHSVDLNNARRWCWRAYIRVA